MVTLSASGATPSFVNASSNTERVPLPLFALVFLLLCALNSAVPLVPSLLPHYQPIKHMLVEASNWGLLLAIASLGLSTSVRTIIALGWRHIATALGTTVVIFVVVTGGLLLMRTGG
ncbi:MAG: putative sulfate exporter family transporter [Xanthobacteraceae bacterium]